MKNQLSEIYSSKVLLNEEKTPVVKGAKELDSKIGKAGLVKNQGPEKQKKDVETPDEDKKYSDGAKAKDMTKESVNTYEGAFEKLFKATINEQEMESGEMELDVEVPTETEDMVDELEDEGSDLISDLRDVMDKLQTILGRLSEEEGSEEEENSEMNMENESEDESEDEETPYEESVSMEDKGHALHGMKAGTQMMSKGNMKVASKLKTSTGGVNKGTLKDSPEAKELGDKKGSLQSKKGMQVQSSVKPGDFFK